MAPRLPAPHADSAGGVVTTPPTGQTHAPAADTAWSEPSALVAAMLNPALIASLLSVAAGSYERQKVSGMPWHLSFIVAPMTLHRGTRQALPANTRTHLSTWVTRNPMLRAGFPRQAKALVMPVQAGLRFALLHDVLELRSDCLKPRTRLRAGAPARTELEDILHSARLIGSWMAKNETAAVFASLGVRP
ncbi:three component ABC system middle component [Streptomyces sp. Rer75]|uniref:three component ABC system middle component n=1 Tax=Streptomyces sp. Rer75 TaxID=2750011 RepID=UPI00211F0152|nr:three component ABC system middle component [Streptomyces sp. Rer75]